MKLNLIFILCILLVIFTGCEKPPVTEMDNAREVVFRAENDANASQFAGSTLARARNALQRMQEEADNKRYDAAKNLAAEAISLAERAILDGKQGAGRIKDESAAIVSTLRPEIEETERNVNGARYSQMALDFDELEKEIVNAHESTDRAEASQAEGKYQDAVDIARGVRSDLSDINSKVAGAATSAKK